MFSDIFFLGKLSTASALQVHWRPLRSSLLGKCYRTASDSPSIIALNSRDAEVSGDSKVAIGTLLHEMTHAYLQACQAARDRRSRAIAKPRKIESDASKNVQCPHALGRDDPDLGVSCHGRAWHHLAMAVERNLDALLGLSTVLGRVGGMATEIRAIATHCEASLEKVELLIEPILPVLANMSYHYNHERLMNSFVRPSDLIGVDFTKLMSRLIQERVAELTNVRQSPQRAHERKTRRRSGVAERRSSDRIRKLQSRSSALMAAPRIQIIVPGVSR